MFITNNLSDKVLSLRATRIAVAYVGADWREYIDLTNVSEIVVSPTFGTNPRAVREIANELKWENVHFLNELHAKIYLGNDSAIVGSANLSFNGLSGEGLLEAGILISDVNELAIINNYIDELILKAKSQYKSTSAKEIQLYEVEKNRRIVQRDGIITNEQAEQTFKTFSAASIGPFATVWYLPDADITLDIDTISKSGADQATFKKRMNFLEDDDIKKGDWVLCWETGNDGLPLDCNDSYWLYVDDVIPGAVTEAPYTKLAVQHKGKLKVNEPFKLDSPTKRALASVLRNEKFVDFREGSKPWSVDAAKNQYYELLKAVEQELNNTK